MKFMTTWAALPGATHECIEKFLAGEGASEEGVTLLGRWHNVDFSGGFSLSETDNAVQIYKGAAKWADLLELSTVPVIEDAQAAPVLAAAFKK
ncbi:MAG: DUF3303 domain-containing protein [Terracidiphilus sp.]